MEAKSASKHAGRAWWKAFEMNDSDIRGIVLRYYYDRRHEPSFQWEGGEFGDELKFEDIIRASQQLSDEGLIDWHPFKSGRGEVVGGRGKINVHGANVIEGKVRAGIAITIDQRKNISVTHSQFVQIGDGNVQEIRLALEKLVQTINDSSGTPQQKTEAKGLLRKFLEHPLVVQVGGRVLAKLILPS